VKALADSLIDGIDILFVWGLAAACFYVRMFYIQRLPVPHDPSGWAQMLGTAAAYSALVIAQEHFRGKNRAARIKNIWRRGLVVVAAGLGPAIGEAA